MGKPERERPVVLVADDDPEIRAILRANLDDFVCDVFVANNGEEALEQLLVERPDLVLLDVMMPEFNGWEICKYVKEKPQLDHTAVLILTAIGKTVNDLTSPLYGADAYLDKPFDLDELNDTISRLLAERGHEWNEADVEV